MPKKDIIIVTGGAGFVGTNLIKLLLKKTKYKIVSLDDYSSGTKLNHIRSPRLKYIKGKTVNISKLIRNNRRINSVFHFGEFARIYQSFVKMNECIDSNSVGSNAVFNFCLKNKIKLIYSATSASLGNKGNDKNLSPYAFSKAKNLELLENLKKWFNFKYEVVYFYNVYGPKQICSGNMATVIGIFEDQFKKKKPLTVVKPGNQKRDFTHIDDIVNGCYLAWIKGRQNEYMLGTNKQHKIIEIAKMFNSKIKYLPPRLGERYASAMTSMNLSNKVYKLFGKIHLKNYVKNITKSS